MAILLAAMLVEVLSAQGSWDSSFRLDDPDLLLVMRGISVGSPRKGEQAAIDTLMAPRLLNYVKLTKQRLTVDSTLLCNYV